MNRLPAGHGTHLITGQTGAEKLYELESISFPTSVGNRLLL